jgi:hypothetical protein|eukprot:SAG25_NODE_1290_length_3388_cov_66.197628_1_plen_79_part_00
MSQGTRLRTDRPVGEVPAQFRVGTVFEATFNTAYTTRCVVTSARMPRHRAFDPARDVQVLQWVVNPHLTDHTVQSNTC